MFLNLILEQKENKARGKKVESATMRASFAALAALIPFALRGWAFRLPFAQPQP
jgi:hypothetical protein